MSFALLEAYKLTREDARYEKLLKKLQDGARARIAAKQKMVVWKAELDRLTAVRKARRDSGQVIKPSGLNVKANQGQL